MLLFVRQVLEEIVVEVARRVPHLPERLDTRLLVAEETGFDEEAMNVVDVGELALMILEQLRRRDFDSTQAERREDDAVLAAECAVRTARRNSNLSSNACADSGSRSTIRSA